MNALAMRQSLEFGPAVDERASPTGGDDYFALAERIVRTGLVSDPWASGAPRFGSEAVVLSAGELRELYTAAERIAFAYHEAMVLCAQAPSILSEFFGLTEWQTWMAQASLPLFHGIARADVFRTPEGTLQICELNADTPTGQPEALALGRLAASPHRVDPNRRLEERFIAMVSKAVAALVHPDAPRTAAIIYPTEIPEDLAVVRLYRSWLQKAGWKVVGGSPFNVTQAEGGAPSVFGSECSLIVRHYKTDWWGERLPVFRGVAAFSSSQPLVAPLMTLLNASVNRKCAVINPFGSVVAQNKRTMAFFWEHLGRFSSRSQAAIRELIPYTVRLDSIGPDALRGARDEWVLKSDYGCEGDEVLVGRYTTDAEWHETLDKAIPKRWIAQRRFGVEEGTRGESINYGVYLLGGVASGIYTRSQRGPTDLRAMSVPVLVRTAEGRR